jgi:hypothetical protein
MGEPTDDKQESHSDGDGQVYAAIITWPERLEPSIGAKISEMIEQNTIHTAPSHWHIEVSTVKKEKAATLPSLDVLATSIQAERESQVKHFENLDTKAGLILGFSGVLVTLGNTARGGSRGASLGLTLIGLSIAAGAALFAMTAYTPRSFPVLNLRKVRDGYLTSQPETTQLRLLDTKIKMVQEASNLLELKGRRLKVALRLLVVAIMFLAGGILAGPIGTLIKQGFKVAGGLLLEVIIYLATAILAGPFGPLFGQVAVRL